MHNSLLIPLVALIGLGATLPLGLESARAEGVTSRGDVMPVKDIKRGMKGYGLTVFEGTKPERFEVEVIDVLHNFRPRQELILIKTKHPRLEVAKVVAGMSGSPIFLEDKMVGAYAYGWTFGKEPVAGVTPIRNMLDDLVRPLPKDIFGWPLKPLPDAPGGRPKISQDSRGAATSGSAKLARADRFSGDVDDYDLMAHAGQVHKRSGQVSSSTSPVAPVATPLLIGGMTTGSVDLVKELLAPLGLEPMQAGGGGANDPNAPTRYENGGAIGVQLVRGDMSAMGLGTVTRVEGDKLVAFGHPMMEAGVTALPTAIGRVLWFLASDMRSFKIGMPVREVGAMVQDRQASIVVSHAAKAPIIPVELSVKGVPGAPHTKWNFEVAHEPFMTPAFLAIALGNALSATASERQDISWNAKSRLKVRGHGELVIEDYGVSDGGSLPTRDIARSNLVQAAGALLNNPWEPAFVEGVSMEIELRYAREILRLRGAEILEPEIDAGDSARIRLTLEPYAGREQTRIIEVPIPVHLAGETVELNIAPGYLVPKDQAPPDKLAELLQNIEDPVYPAKSIVVSFSSGEGAVAFKGRIARNLPPGALDSINPTTSSVAPSLFGTQIRHVVPLPLFMTGRDSVSVKVRPVLR